MKLLLGALGFAVVGMLLLVGDSLTLRFNWPTVIVWTILIPGVAGLGFWHVVGIIEGQAREIARLRREIEVLSRLIDEEISRSTR